MRRSSKRLDVSHLVLGFLGALLLTSGSCSSKGGLVIVQITAEPMLVGVAKLHATVTAGGRTQMYDFVPKDTTLPPLFDFALEMPPSITGNFVIDVDALDSSMLKLATAHAEKALAGGGTITVGVSFVGAQNPDGGGPSNMVPIVAGDFFMGCDPVADATCGSDEQPGRMVTLAAYSIDKNEVTETDYKLCVDAGNCTMPTGFDPVTNPTLPVTNVTWYQADAYCKWTGKRLPTEAEWERAARGTDQRIFPWGGDTPNCGLANFMGCGDVAKPVGSLPTVTSPEGVLDMAGNAWEWVADFYQANYYGSNPPMMNPKGPATGTTKVIRGGGFDASSTARTLRASARSQQDPSTTGTGVSQGFRCAK
jgi:formylglycine-generating enzyme required for sulfatase activity